MNEEPLDFHRLGRAIARGKWLVIAFVIAGILVAALFTAVRRPQYEASTVVLLPPAPQTGAGQPARDAQTEGEVATSVLALQYASKALPDHPSPNELKQRVTVSSPTASVLVFKGHARSARDAIALSNAAAHAYQAYSKKTSSDQAQQVIAPLNERVKALVSSNLDLQDKVNHAVAQQEQLDPQSAEFSRLNLRIAQWQSQMQVSAQELQSVRNQIATADAGATAVNAISVISPASAATDNIVKTTGANLFGGALIGLLLGVTIVLARDSRARARRRPLDVSTAVGVPIVASLAAPTVRNKGEWLALLDAHEPSPDEQWGLRKLLRSVLVADGAEAGTATATATVVTLASDDAALAVAPQLASFAAGAGVRTVLVVGSASRSALVLRQVRDVAAVAGLAPRENLSLVDEMPSEPGDDLPPVDLVVRMVVADRSGHGFERIDGTTMLLAVAPNAATAEQLRAVADAAFDANAPFAGIVIASPERDDAVASASVGSAS